MCDVWAGALQESLPSLPSPAAIHERPREQLVRSHLSADRCACKVPRLQQSFIADAGAQNKHRFSELRADFLDLR